MLLLKDYISNRWNTCFCTKHITVQINVQQQSISCNSETQFIKDKMNNLVNKSRRNNIRVDGLIEADKETWKESEQMFQDVIGWINKLLEPNGNIAI